MPSKSRVGQQQIQRASAYKNQVLPQTAKRLRNPFHLGHIGNDYQ